MHKNKRDLLKGMAVGSVWVTPTVNSVMLPIHAATTLCSGMYSAKIQETIGWCFIPGACVLLDVDCENSMVSASVQAIDTDPFTGTLGISGGEFSGLLDGTGGETGSTINISGTVNGDGTISGLVTGGNFCTDLTDQYTAVIDTPCTVTDDL